MLKHSSRRWTAVFALIIPALSAGAQPPQDPRAHADLFRTPFARHSGLFDAFNRCDLTKLESYFSRSQG